MTPLIDELLEKSHEFSFVQVMRLARRYLDPNGEAGIPGVSWQERVRIRPELSLAFPASDVSKVERDGDDLKVTATFLGLYGPSSPLPTFYTEDLMDEASSDESVFRDFLDIIHQRLYHLYFECWSKYRLLIRIIEEDNHIDRERLLCLIGLGERELADSVPEAFSLLRYTGILTQYPRSATGLATMLRDMLGMKDLRIMQNVKRMVPIPADQRMRLGVGNCRLGIDTVLGSQIADRMGKFRMRIGPLTWRECNDLLPGTPRHDRLTRYTRFYLTDPLEVDVELVLAAGEAKPIRLGDPDARVGLNTWCFSGDSLGEVSAVFRMAEMPNADTPSAAKPTFATRQSRGFVDLYREERAALDKEAARYVEEHPNLAPLMSGSLADQGVERLFEGTAFLNALLRQKLEDDFPEFIHEIIGSQQPEYLRPVPASSIAAFIMKPNCTEPRIIPKGTQLDSVPVEGTRCRFRTCYDTEVYPLSIVGAGYFHSSGRLPMIRLHMELNGMPPSDFRPDSLRFFLGNDHSAACHLYLLLTRFLHRVVITPEGDGSSAVLPADCLRPAGFGNNEIILPGFSDTVASHQILREYFLFPFKYLFVELSGFEKWKDRGDGSRFHIMFELINCPFGAPIVGAQSFVLSATPIINLFHHQAIPLQVDASTERYQVRPAGKIAEHFHLFDLDGVSGVTPGNRRRRGYVLFNHADKDFEPGSMCFVTREKSSFQDGYDTYLSLFPDERERSQGGKLAVNLTCTNGTLPERLDIGDIRIATAGTPESVEFTNIAPVTPTRFPLSEKNILWRHLSAFSLNRLSLLAPVTFRSIVRLYTPGHSRCTVAVDAVEKRIEGIVGIEAEMTDRIICGAIYRGHTIRLKFKGDHFSGPGELYLFCSVLERFLGGYATQKCFTRLIAEDVVAGHVFDWPPRFGDGHVL